MSKPTTIDRDATVAKLKVKRTSGISDKAFKCVTLSRNDSARQNIVKIEELHGIELIKIHPDSCLYSPKCKYKFMVRSKYDNYIVYPKQKVKFNSKTYIVEDLFKELVLELLNY